ncbi:MAG: hypothetical protein ACRCXL_07590 [Dermatophilaceae bacterium]
MPNQGPRPGALVIRPDGQVTWAADPTDSVLAQAVSAWVGKPTRAEARR